MTNVQSTATTVTMGTTTVPGAGQLAGKVGIITGFFAVEAHRRVIEAYLGTGFEPAAR